MTFSQETHAQRAASIPAMLRRGGGVLAIGAHHGLSARPGEAAGFDLGRTGRASDLRDPMVPLSRVFKLVRLEQLQRDEQTYPSAGATSA
jgi:hypothetical protein